MRTMIYLPLMLAVCAVGAHAPAAAALKGAVPPRAGAPVLLAASPTSGAIRIVQNPVRPDEPDAGSASTLETPDAGAREPANRIVAVREVKLGHEVGEIRVNGNTVFRFRGTKTLNPYARAQIVAARLNAPSMANLRAGEVGVRRVGGYWTVMARGASLITADEATARINRTSPRRLALLWAENLRAQLREEPAD